jgi:hypothetical protein
MMTHRFMTALVLSLGMGLLVESTAGVLPEDLRRAARELACVEPADFYDRPGLFEPPYVLGYLSGDAEASAVFWCINKVGPPRYSLVVWRNPAERPASSLSCPSTVRWDNPPGGLSILKDVHLPLSEFWYVGSPQHRGPQGLTSQGPIIRSAYDGAGAHFYCHEGEWLVQQFH